MIARRDRLNASPYLAASGFLLLGIVYTAEPGIYILLQSFSGSGSISTLTRLLGLCAVVQGILSSGAIALLIIAIVRRPLATQVRE